MKNNDKKDRKPLDNGSKGGETVERSSSYYANMEAVEAKPLEVIVYNNNIEKAFRAFRALVQKERILSTYKERQTYEKPSDRKRRKRNERKRKLLELNNPREPRSNRDE